MLESVADVSLSRLPGVAMLGENTAESAEGVHSVLI
jgi:hypothetical protein